MHRNIQLRHEAEESELVKLRLILKSSSECRKRLYQITKTIQPESLKTA